MTTTGVEPAHPKGHYPLKVARLPIPPRGQFVIPQEGFQSGAKVFLPFNFRDTAVEKILWYFVLLFLRGAFFFNESKTGAAQRQGMPTSSCLSNSIFIF